MYILSQKSDDCLLDGEVLSSGELFAPMIYSVLTVRSCRWRGESNWHMYEIEYTHRALEDIRWFKKHEQNVIVDAIEQATALRANSRNTQPENDAAQ